LGRRERFVLEQAAQLRPIEFDRFRPFGRTSSDEGFEYFCRLEKGHMFSSRDSHFTARQARPVGRLHLFSSTLVVLTGGFADEFVVEGEFVPPGLVS